MVLPFNQRVSGSNPDGLTIFRNEELAGGDGPEVAREIVGFHELAAAFEAGIDALLDKDYPRAQAAFLQADGLRPGDPRITANLRRLEELGHRRPS